MGCFVCQFLWCRGRDFDVRDHYGHDLRFKCTNPPPDQNANGNVIKTYGVVLKLKGMGQGGAGNRRGGGFQDPRWLGWTP